MKNTSLKVTAFVFSYLLISFIINYQNCFASQPLDTLWTKTFGGTNIDIGHCVEQTFDGGYIITGYTRSYGTMSGRNVLLIKTDENGVAEWINGYGGNDDDEGYSVKQTPDGGYIIAGHTKSFGAGLKDVYLIKTDSLGTQQWTKTFGGAQDDEGYSVQQTNDGGFIIGGVTSSSGAGSRDVWLIKTDASGNLSWQKTHGGMSSDGAWYVQKTSDGGYILAGWTFSYGPGYIGNAWLVKTDSSGNQQWHQYFGGDDADRAYSVQQTSDGGFILTGYTDSFGAGLYDMLLIKTDSLGNSEWLKTFGGSGRDYGNSVQQTTDGGFIITGYTLSYGAGGDDVWLVKTDINGNEEWNKTFGGTSSDVGFCIKQTSDGGYIITGHTLSFGAGVHDVWLIKLDSIIPVELVSFSGNVSNGKVELAWITASEINNMGFEVERTSLQTSQCPDCWVRIGFVEGIGSTLEYTYYSFIDENVMPETYYYRLKQIDFQGTIEYSNKIEIKVSYKPIYSLSQNYPNPFNPSTTINYSIKENGNVQLKVYDLLGREVAILVNEEKPAGSHTVEFNGDNLAGGIYFYRLATENFISTKKLILLK